MQNWPDLSQVWTRVLLFLPRIIASMVMLVLSILLANLLQKAVRHAMKRRKANASIKLLLEKLTRWTIITLGIITALKQVNFDVTAFLTGLGILGFTIGFAMQDVGKNVVAGILLLLQQPFGVGDVIQVGNFTGKVLTLDIRAIKLDLFDGTNVLIPNSQVLSGPIVNLQSAFCRIALTMRVSRDSDLEAARHIAFETIANIRGVLADPSPKIAFSALGASTVDLNIYFWIDPTQINLLDAKDATVVGIKAAFDEAHIEIC